MPHPPIWYALTSPARVRLQLDRLRPASLPEVLHTTVAAFEHPSITSGFALRVTGTIRPSRTSVAKSRKSTTRVLVAPTEALRDDWLAALRLRLAPASMIGEEVSAIARGAENYGVLARDAHRAMAQVTSGAGTGLSVAAPATEDGSQGQSQDRSQSQGQGAGGDESAGAELFAERAIELVKIGCASSSFSTTCLQALQDVVSVSNVDTLSRSFGGVALVGLVLAVAGFTVKYLLMVSLAEAELPKLLSMTGTIEVVARKLFVIAYDIAVRSLEDGDELTEECVQDVLAAFVNCADLAADVERHVLHSHAWRAMHVDDVDGLRTRLAELEISLNFSRHPKFAADLEARFVQVEARFAHFGDRLDRVERAQTLNQDRIGLLNTRIVGVEELNVSIAGVQETMVAADAGEAYTPVFYRIPKVPQSVVFDGITQLKPLLEVLCSGGGISVVSGEQPTLSSSGSTSSLSFDENAISIATRGWGGVGKTLACVILAQDETVRKAFPGGGVFLNFGEQVMDAVVVGQLRDFVVATGEGPEGKRIVDAIDKVEPTRTQVARVVGLVAEWVKGRRVLFVADNLFTRAHGVPWAEELAKLAEISGSALLYSTRRSDLAEFAPPERRFVFERIKDSAIAREIFLGYAGLEQSAVARDPVQNSTIDLILSTCAGWQLVLKMAGMMVQKLDYNWAKVKETIDTHYLLKLSLPEGGVRVIMSVA